MNKSLAYRLAIQSVMKDEDIGYDDTTDILNILFSDYNTAKWREGQEDTANKEAQA